MRSARRPGGVRVFFALWPDEAVRKALHAQGRLVHAQLGGRPTRAASIHMTLLFLGEIEEHRLAALQDAAGNVDVEPFGMSLNRVACWPHNRIAWAGPERVPPALEDLVGRLRQTVAQAGFSFDRKPFAAHVTLLRDAACRALEPDMASIAWRVSDFVLVRSSLDAGGSNYQVIGRWGAREEA
ncbi:MAG: RNA 2',3'-cyclic phosphodiesterase [Burkholderiales bacterium]|nr:RNA 2',3'-cyclic phosphodiesterase [Burkholderiales bacterium]